MVVVYETLFLVKVFQLVSVYNSTKDAFLKKTKKVIKDIKAEFKTIDPNLEIKITEITNSRKSNDYY